MHPFTLIILLFINYCFQSCMCELFNFVYCFGGGGYSGCVLFEFTHCYLIFVDQHNFCS